MATETRRMRNTISSEIGKHMSDIKLSLKHVNTDLERNLQSRRNCHGNYELSVRLIKEKKKLVERRNLLTKRYNQLKVMMRQSEKNFRLSLITL